MVHQIFPGVHSFGMSELAAENRRNRSRLKKRIAGRDFGQQNLPLEAFAESELMVHQIFPGVHSFGMSELAAENRWNRSRLNSGSRGRN